MSTLQKIPKRLRILPNMHILGLPELDMELGPGVYRLGENMDESLAIALASPEFSHCVEIMADQPEPEPLGEIKEGPKEAFGYAYSRKKQHEQELEQWKRIHGRTHAPVDEVKGLV